MRSLFALLSAGPSARLFLAGVVFLALHPSIYKRCGCDVENVTAPMIGDGYLYSGRVYDFETGAGLGGARLNFDGPDSDYEVTTGEDGTYISPRIRGGFQLSVSYDGFHTRSRDIVIEDDRSDFNISLSRYYNTALRIDDVDVRADEPLDNRESETHLHVGGTEFPGNQFQTYFRFSVPGLPENARISYAGVTMWTDPVEGSSAENPRYFLTNIIENWNPSEVNWFNQPNVGTLSVGSLIDAADFGGTTRLRFDVTQALRYYYKEMPPEPIFGVRLNWDQDGYFEVLSTEYSDGGTGEALSGFATWYLRGNDFGE
jgi:hypothetical protein